MSAGPITLQSGGPRVRKFQKAVNGHLGRRRFPWRKIPVNGDPSKQMVEAANLVAWQLGFSEEQLRKLMKRREVSRHVELVILGEKPRTTAMKKRDKARRDEAAKLRRRHREKGTLAAVVIHSTKPGRPDYAGTTDVMGQLVAPLLHGKYGYPIGSGKRTPRRNAEVGGSPNSDHLTTKTRTFARDFPTFDGERAARALARLVGWRDWQPNSFATFDFSIGKFHFRIQILWGAAIDHDDHIHVGIEFLGVW